MAKPTLYLMVGYPGAGKTTTAKLIHEITGAVHLWADRERNQRFPNPTHQHHENLALYSQLNEETRQLLQAGKSVIFDTNFNFYKDREHLRQIATEVGARTVVVWLTTEKTLAHDRAVAHPSPNETRIWGNMPEIDFERISGKLEPPKPEEHPITLVGKNLSREAVEQALAAEA